MLGILVLCLSQLICISKRYLDFVQNMNAGDKEKKNVGDKNIDISTLISEPMLEKVYKKVFEEFSKKMKRANPASIGQNTERNLESKMNTETNVLEFIRTPAKSNCIRLEVVDKSKPNFLDEYVLTEDANGILVVFREANQKCIIVPESESIGEKEYDYRKLKECYEADVPVKSGYYYNIVQVLEPCIVKKSGGNYLIESKGKLKLEQK